MSSGGINNVYRLDIKLNLLVTLQSWPSRGTTLEVNIVRQAFHPPTSSETRGSCGQDNNVRINHSPQHMKDVFQHKQFCSE